MSEAKSHSESWKSSEKGMPEGHPFSPYHHDLSSELALEGRGAAATWVGALEGKQHPWGRAWTQVTPTVLSPHPRLSLASFLGGSLTLVEGHRPHLGPWLGLHREACGAVCRSWLCSWQEWLGAGAGMMLQRKTLWLQSRWERSPQPRPWHPILPHLPTSWEWGLCRGHPR